MTPVAVMVGANRIVPAAGIIHPLGNADLSAENKKTPGNGVPGRPWNLAV